MRKVEINPDPSKEVNWDIPQWVQHIKEKDIIILTIGRHNGTHFEGMCLPCKDYLNGHYATNWFKGQFTRLEGVVPFEISND